MSEKYGRYDGETQMYTQAPRELNMNTLESIKWEVDNGKRDDDLHADVIKLDDVRKELGEIGQH